MSSGVSSPNVSVQPEGIVIGDAVYSGVLLTLDSSLVPEEKRAETPSMRDGLELHTETELRILGCELIQSAGILLRLPQVAMATGQVLFQRFFYTKSFIKHDCECPRRVRDVINVFHHLKQGGGKRSVPMFLDQNYINTKNQVIRAERRVLKELGFCVHVKHPHKMIVMYLQVLECEKNQTLVQTAWNYMNDALRTDVFVRFEPETIACACIYLAARTLQIALPTRPHWFLLFGASECDIREICISTLKLYSRKKLEEEVEKKKKCLETEKLKSVNHSMTPALNHTNTFSPASKPASPRELKSEDESKQREKREEQTLNSKTSISSVKENRVLQNGHVTSRGRATSLSPATGHSESYRSPSSHSPSPRRHRHQRSPTVLSDKSRHRDGRRCSRSRSDSRGRHHNDRKHKQERWEKGERERSLDRGLKHKSRTHSAHSHQRR
ncbi:Cyclin-L1 [Bagarius yarrelli]|uniref:Cyclin-L1 n=1 Tax=Bagarius yarrelli TaxID=175774 RepID=A0A556TZQ3_BAGYA|nr:Cyclin-L1 [Bagarius yarrelli]